MATTMVVVSDVMKLSERLKQLRGKMSQVDAAKRSGISQQMWSKLETERSEETSELPQIAKAFGCRLDWLAYGDEPMYGAGPSATGVRSTDDAGAADIVLIKETEITFKGGAGHELTYEVIQESEPATYRRTWFQEERMAPDDCIRFKVSGDSNVPFLFPGDTVLVHLKEQEIRNGYMYAFWHEGEGRRIKRLFRKQDGSLILKSWNPDYVDEVVLPADAEEKIVIIGRVRDKAGKGGLTGRG